MRLCVVFVVVLSLVSLGTAEELYKVSVRSHQDATRLAQLRFDALLRIGGGYLMLLHAGQESHLAESGLLYEHLASGVSRDNLALDRRRDSSYVARLPLVYAENGLRIFRVDPTDLQTAAAALEIAPILTKDLRIVYQPQERRLWRLPTPPDNLDSLIDLILEDSLESYSLWLEAYNGRMAGTSSNRASKDWLAGKFAEFGYDSVLIDTFMAQIDGYPEECYNVIARKPGTVYPDYQILIGAHRDTYPLESPGADDNGSGSAGVLEIARVLSQMETHMTFVFILFDAEEWGLYGSWHYANEAAERGDSIALMINMDVIGYYENEFDAYAAYGWDSLYTNLWCQLADSLEAINLTCHMSGGGGGSDHYPFYQNGYEILYLSEYIWTPYIHSAHDSTTYLSYEYMARIIRGVMATAVTVDLVHPVAPLIFAVPGGAPDIFYPEYENTIQLLVREQGPAQVLPGSVQMFYAIDDGGWDTLPMVPANDSLYEAVLPSQECRVNVEFYFSAEEDSAGIMYYPSPDDPLQAIVATRALSVFQDDFETDQGWAVTGDARMGMWERADPNGGCGAPARDIDGSGNCYVTANGLLMNVDDGKTVLTSPALTNSGEDVEVIYARWYSNHCPWGEQHNDIFKVYVGYSTAGGYLVETIGPVEQAEGGWHTRRFWLSDFLEPQESFCLRFEASDYGNPSHVEAAVDAVRIIRYTCDPLIITESLPDWTAGVLYSQVLEAVGGTGSFTWMDKNGDLVGTGLSLSPQGLLGGTPTVEGEIAFIALTTDDSLATDEKALSFDVNPAPAVVSDSLPGGRQDQPYVFQLEASGGTGEIAWSDRDGDLAGTGVSLSAEGELSGTFLLFGSLSFVARVEDEVGGSGERMLIINVMPPYICGDMNADDSGPNIVDVSYLVTYLFAGGPPPPVEEIADINGGDGVLNIVDLTYLVNYLFGGGPDPDCID